MHNLLFRYWRNRVAIFFLCLPSAETSAAQCIDCREECAVSLFPHRINESTSHFQSFLYAFFLHLQFTIISDVISSSRIMFAIANNWKLRCMSLKLDILKNNELYWNGNWNGANYTRLLFFV